MKTSTPLMSALLMAPSLLSAQVLVNDDWTDENFAKTGTLDADWWSSNHPNMNSLEIATDSVGAITGGLKLISGSSGRGLHASFAPQTLGEGDTLTATFTFTTPATIGANRSTAFKVAMMDGSDPGVASHLLSSSSSPNALYIDLPGYMVDYDVNKTDSSENATFRKHNLSTTPAPDTNTTGRFLGTTGEWTSMGGSADDDGGYKFLPDTEYTGVFSVSKTATGLDLFTSLSQGATLMESHTETDLTDLVNNFGMLAFWVNSNTFGTLNTGGQADSGITFSQVTIVRDPVPPAPPLTITDFDYDKASDTATIQWVTEVGRTYLLFASDDLQTWEEIDDLTSAATVETFTAVGAAATHKYYRVEEVAP